MRRGGEWKKTEANKASRARLNFTRPMRGKEQICETYCGGEVTPSLGLTDLLPRSSLESS